MKITNNVDSFNSLNTNIVNIAAGVDYEKRQILEWLSPLEPHQRHHGVRTDRIDGVGSWLLEISEFRRWSDASGGDGSVPPVLFCYGDQGVGKTYLSSLVIDHLCDQAGKRDIAVVGLYCDFLAQHEQSTANMLGAILKQLVNRGEIPGHLVRAFKTARKEFGGRRPLLPDLLELMKMTVASLPQVFICVDALDEVIPKHRLSLLRSLRGIIQGSPNTRIFLTGRAMVLQEIKEHFTRAAMIPISPTKEDIEAFLVMRLESDTELDAMDDDLRADIMRVIPEKISEIFILVSLNMDAILGEITIHQRRKMLHTMTKGKGLGDAYTATLARIKAQTGARSRLAMQALMWVLYSERPLHVVELCHALGVERGSPNSNPENIPHIGTVLRCSLGLLTVETSSSIVRLVHYTLQEYLSDNPTLFHSPHSTIAEICLTYLNFERVRDLSPTLSSAPPTTPFLDYASRYWGAHARRETTESMIPLALRLLDRFDKHVSSNILLSHAEYRRGQPQHIECSPEGFTGLHGAAFLGLVDITVALLEIKEWDLNATNPEDDTALILAATNGHEGVVEVLLERINANPDIPDSWGRGPLLRAAENGHVGVVKMLLERTGVNPEIVGYWGRSPLSLAAENGHERVVKVLLEQGGVDPNTVDTKYGQTPLSWAAETGHEKVVEVLLERNDINLELADKYGRTPLSWATQNGHKGAVTLLLERGGSFLNLQADRSTSLIIPNESSELPEPPSKRIRYGSYSRPKFDISPSPVD